MIAHLMIYGLEVALLLAVAAWAVERIAIRHGWPRRVGWVAALVLSVAIPIVGILLPPAARITPAPTPEVTLSVPAAPGVNSVAATHRVPAVTTRPQVLETRSSPSITRSVINWARTHLENILATGWLSASCGLLVGFLFLNLRLRRAARSWRREQVEGQDVWVTQSLGPAVYGFLDPIVLLPQWLLQAENNELSVAMAHEKSHLAARDPALLLLGLSVIAILPWNLPLWWQLRRLRFAIEVDCDTRVLNRGLTPRDYGSALLTIGERGNGAPLGAVALTEPASQLLRRIQIMTADLPKRSAGAVVAAVALAVTCVAVAAGTRAPASLSTAANGDLPRKLPVDAIHNDPQVEALVRATYPQFFHGTGNTQPVLISLFLHPDGSLFKSVFEAIAPRPYITISYAAFDAVGIDFAHRGPDRKLRIQGASGLPVDVVAWYFQAPADPTRDVATVRAKAKARYAGLLSSADADKVVTILMTDSGEIERASVEPLNGRTPESLATPGHFAAAGFPSDRLGLMGVTAVFSGQFYDDPDAKSLPVVYAWPRRANEHSTQFEVFNRDAPSVPNDDRNVDKLLAEHYFPDLYTYPPDWPRADPWILLDRQGKVLTAGRRVVMSYSDIQLNIESLYPGIKTDRVQGVTFRGPRGQRPDVAFVWLAADSPVTDPAKADFTRQPDVLVYADVSIGGKTFWTEMLALNFGATGTTRAAMSNPFGVAYLQLALDKGDANAAAIRIRWQHMPLPANETIPDSIATAWSPQTAPIRAVYGGSSETQITAADGQKWDIVLHADRMSHAAPQTVTAPL